MKIKRFYSDLGHHLESGKVLVIFGPRQVGKTTEVLEILKEYQPPSHYASVELETTPDILWIDQ